MQPNRGRGIAGIILGFEKLNFEKVDLNPSPSSRPMDLTHLFTNHNEKYILCQ